MVLKFRGIIPFPVLVLLTAVSDNLPGQSKDTVQHWDEVDGGWVTHNHCPTVQGSQGKAPGHGYLGYRAARVGSIIQHTTILSVTVYISLGIQINLYQTVTNTCFSFLPEIDN